MTQRVQVFFPTVHAKYAVESQVRHHNLSPSSSMITIEPPSPEHPVLPTSHILSVIDEHASTTALLLLPGIQFYTGQLLDIPTITAHAHSHGIFVIWDLAHAVGNVELKLHEWECDAAAWCTYKYLNAGSGAIGGLFVHERNSNIDPGVFQGNGEASSFTNRLSGWWGSDKQSRFAMTNHFVPIPGAAGFQLSNPSVLDITSLCASLEVFAMTDMASLRVKSLDLTRHLEVLLQQLMVQTGGFEILTPKEPAQRGAQLSLKLEEGLLDSVMGELERRAVVVDERRPDVIRVAPVPLYNTFTDVHDFVEIFKDALEAALKSKARRKAGGGRTDEMLQTTQ
jgi:kynureninase